MNDEQVIITDVGPRDGLQNLAQILTPAQRLEIINGLLDAGITSIEAGAFVSPKAVPAMAGSDEIFNTLSNNQNATFQALIPNLKGYELAKTAGAKTMLAVVCATETMNQKNVRMSVSDSIAQLAEIQIQAQRDNIDIVTCIAVSWCCPFEGKTRPADVMCLLEQITAMGINNIVLADTIGAANPVEVRSLTRDVIAQHGNINIGCHFHDTRAMGLANVYAALESGVRRFDSSVGGLGGCPFAPGATGNVATEDVVMMLEQAGFNTGINLEKLMAVGQLAGSLTHQQTGGRSHTWRTLQLEKNKPLT